MWDDVIEPRNQAVPSVGVCGCVGVGVYGMWGEGVGGGGICVCGWVGGYIHTCMCECIKL